LFNLEVIISKVRWSFSKYQQTQLTNKN